MNAFFFIYFLVVTDVGSDEDYVPPSQLKSQSSSKQRTSRFLSTSSVRSAKRVRLADVVAGAIPTPPALVDSSGDDYIPPIVSDLRTLESRYSVVFLPWFKVCLRRVLSACVLFSCHTLHFVS